MGIIYMDQQKQVSVVNWLFKQRDIDTQVISLLAAAAISGFLSDFTKGIIDPFVSGILRSNKDDVQEVGPFKFKAQLLMSGFMKLVIIFVIIYQLAQLVQSKGL
jgi:hypothetical protein